MARRRFTHTDGTPLTTDELLQLIAKNDRRFRVAQSTFMMVVGIILCVVLGAQYNTLRQFQAQSTERQRALEVIQRATKDSADQQKHYIYCIAKFFATSDRATRVITDLDNCNISEIASQTSSSYDGEPSPVSPYLTLPDGSANTATPSRTPAPAHPNAPSPTPSPATTPPTCRVRVPLVGICVL